MLGTWFPSVKTLLTYRPFQRLRDPMSILLVRQLSHVLGFQAGHEVAHVPRRVRAPGLRRREETALRQPGESSSPPPAAAAAAWRRLPTLSAGSDARSAE